MATFETLSEKTKTQMGSEKGFGLVFATVFFILGLFLVFHDNNFFIGAFVISAIFLTISFTVPHILKPLNKGWFAFGLFLHKIISPLIMGLIFFLVITPFGLIMRLFGTDFLKTKLDQDAESYWIPRDPPGPDSGNMNNQF